MEPSSASTPTLGSALRAAVADLEVVNPWVGLWRFVSLGTVFLSLVSLAWSTPPGLLFAGYTVAAGVFYAFWLVCTHDTVHQTLTGWKWFDTWMPRLISYPMLWPYGTYAHLHRLHHGWNGSDLRDPERVQWTRSEYQQASPLQQWYVRHQWFLDILVLGGIGLIAKTVYQALRFRQQFPYLLPALLGDVLGMLIMQVSFGTLAILQGRFAQYLVFWLILERVIGILMQMRDHLEHYGLWHPAQGHQLTQLYTCRNLNTPSWIAWLVGGLNDHAVHHAFPGIPFNRLAETFERSQQVLARYDLPLMQREDGYLKTTLRLGRHPHLIDETQVPNLRDNYLPAD